MTEKVSEASKIEKTETQCRNMLDLLKKRYKKEKLRMEQIGMKVSKWVFFSSRYVNDFFSKAGLWACLWG